MGMIKWDLKALTLRLRLIFSKSRLFIHGTSSSNLKSILSEGMKARPDSKVWEQGRNPEQESFEGSYWTTSMNKAYDAAWEAVKSFGGQPLFVFSILETRDHKVLIDEDDIAGIVATIPNDLYQDFLKRIRTADELVSAIIKTLSDKLPNVPSKRWESARPVLVKFVHHYYGGSKETTVRDMKKDLTEALRDLTNTNESKTLNVRVTRDVKYKGSHKIVYIGEFVRDQSVVHDRFGSNSEARTMLRSFIGRKFPDTKN